MIFFKIKNYILGAGEKAQQLRTLSALSDDLGSIPSIHWWLTTVYTPVPRNLTPSFGLQGHQAYMWYTDMYRQNTLTQDKTKQELIPPLYFGTSVILRQISLYSSGYPSCR